MTDSGFADQPKLSTRIAIVVALVIVVGLVLYQKQQRKAKEAEAARAAQRDSDSNSKKAIAEAGGEGASSSAGKFPRLLDLGSTTCVACVAMETELEDLRNECSGRLTVDFIDVRKQEKAWKEYGIKVIPTQIFFSAEGEELFRHEGYYSKEDILKKWKELGVELSVKEKDVEQSGG